MNLILEAIMIGIMGASALSATLNGAVMVGIAIMNNGDEKFIKEVTNIHKMPFIISSIVAVISTSISRVYNAEQGRRQGRCNKPI